MSSLSIVIGEKEKELVTKFEKKFKRTLLLHFQKHRLQSEEHIRLGDYVTGIEENKSWGAGYVSTPYTLSPDFTLKERSNKSLLGFKDWIQDIITRLGLNHNLSKKLSSIVIEIGDNLPKVYAEQSKLLDEAVRASEAVNIQAKRMAATETSLRTQISLAESRARDAMEAKELEFKKLEKELIEKSDQIKMLTSTASGQAQSLQSLSSMASLDDACQYTMSALSAYQTMLRELSAVDDPISRVKDNKDSIIREMTSAKRHLENAMSKEWLKAQVQVGLSLNVKMGPTVDAYIAQSILTGQERSMPAQALICKDYIDSVVRELRSYESRLSNQWFKSLRRGWRVKKPIIDSVVKTILMRKSEIKDNGSNARTKLEEIQALIIGSCKQKKTGLEEEVYREGNNFKAVIDSALEITSKALDGRVYQPDPSVILGGVNLDLVVDIHNNSDLCRTLQTQNIEAMSGDGGLPDLITAEVTRAYSCMERARGFMSVIDESVDNVARMKQDFLDRAKRSLSVKSEMPGGVESVQRTIQMAREQRHEVRTLVNRPDDSRPQTRLALGAFPVRGRSLSSESKLERTVQALTLY